jgi:hypothetical protein
MQAIHVYRGKHMRTAGIPDRSLTVDFKPLPHVALHSPTGMNWGYAGSGPADTALSILAHHFGETPIYTDLLRGLCKSVHLYQRFKEEIIAQFPMTLDFQLTSLEIDTWLKRHAVDVAEIEERLQFRRASQA